MSSIVNKGISSGRITVFDAKTNGDMDIYELALTDNITRSLPTNITSLFQLVALATIQKLRNKKEVNPVETMLDSLTDIVLPQYENWRKPSPHSASLNGSNSESTQVIVSDDLVESARCWLLPFEQVEVKSEFEQFYRDISLTHVHYNVRVLPALPKFLLVAASSYEFGDINLLKDFALVEEDTKLRNRNDEQIARMLDIFAGRIPPPK
jgi:hypothetical protein